MIFGEKDAPKANDDAGAPYLYFNYSYFILLDTVVLSRKGSDVYVGSDPTLIPLVLRAVSSWRAMAMVSYLGLLPFHSLGPTWFGRNPSNFSLVNFCFH